jgi:hypothetical protein
MAIVIPGRSIKLTVPLDPDVVLGIHCPESGPSRIALTIEVGGHQLQAELAAKAIRKAQSVIRQGDAFVMVQGRLNGAKLEECGILAQVKAPKPQLAEPAAAA